MDSNPSSPSVSKSPGFSATVSNRSLNGPTRSSIWWNSDFRPFWSPNLPDCQLCQVNFSFFDRPHHCRQCGCCVCSRCSPYQLFLEMYLKICRVCYSCNFSSNRNHLLQNSRFLPTEAGDYSKRGLVALRNFRGLTLTSMTSLTGSNNNQPSESGDEIANYLWREGATSFVYKGTFSEIPVAIKQYKEIFIQDPNRVQVETLIYDSLSSCQFVVSKIFETTSTPYPAIGTQLYDEYGTLGYLLLNHPIHIISPAWRLQVLCQLAEFLDYLHQRSICHMDLKAENCIVVALNSDPSPDQCLVKVFDFNYSLRFGSTSFSALSYTLTHAPPEVLSVTDIDNYYEVDGSYDIFSFGIMMAEISGPGLRYPDEEAVDILPKLRSAIINGCRPLIQNFGLDATVANNYLSIHQSCCQPDRLKRPIAQVLIRDLRELSSQSLISNLNNNQSSSPTIPITSQSTIQIQQFPDYLILVEDEDFDSRKSSWSMIKNSTKKSKVEKLKSSFSDLVVYSKDDHQLKKFYSYDGGKFQIKVVYKHHPGKVACYIPIEYFASEMLKEKQAEFVGIMQGLGAKRISLSTQGRTDTVDKNYGKVGLKGAGLSLKVGNQTSIEETFNCTQSFDHPFSSQPYFNHDRKYIFYPHERDWQILRELREKESLLQQNVRFTFSSSTLFNANIELQLSTLTALGIGRSTLRSFNINQQYEIEFYSKVDYLESNRQSMRGWNPLVVMQFLDHYHLSSYKSIFAQDPPVRGIDLISLNIRNILEARNVSSVEIQRIIDTVNHHLNGSTTFQCS